jgi:hypothetical protein
MVDLHCPVTLKVISERYLAHESARLRFLREAHAAARLRHPTSPRSFTTGLRCSSSPHGPALSCSKAGRCLVSEDGQTGSDLCRDFERQLHLQPLGPSNEILAENQDLVALSAYQISRKRSAPGKRPSNQHLFLVRFEVTRRERSLPFCRLRYWLPLKAGFSESFQLAAVVRHIQHTESVSNESGIAYRVAVEFRR